jgi:hypothetical protein
MERTTSLAPPQTRAEAQTHQHGVLGPWDSYTSALIFPRPRPSSIQLTPQFRIAVFRKRCSHAESDGIIPLPPTFASGLRLAFRPGAGDDHVRLPPRAAVAMRRRQPSFPNRRSIACHLLSRPTYRRSGRVLQHRSCETLFKQTPFEELLFIA